MYSITTALQNILLQPSRVIDVKAEISTYTITSDSIGSFTIEHSLTEDENYSFGSACSRKLTLEFYKTDEVPLVLSGQSIKFYVGICSDANVTIPREAQNFTWIPMGTFNIDKSGISLQNNIYTIEAYDKMDDFSYVKFNGTHTLYTTTTALLNAVRTQTGFNYSGHENVALTRKIEPSADELVSVRGALQQMGQMIGSNAIITRDNQIKFIKPSTTKNLSITAENYESFEQLDTDVQKLGKISNTTTIGEDERSFSYGSGTEFALENNNITSNTICQQIATRAKLPFSYYAYQLVMQGQPQIDVGDLIELTDVKGSKYNLYVFSHELSYDGTLKSTIKAAPYPVSGITAGGESLAESVGTFRNQINYVTHLVADTIEADNARFNKLETDKADIKDLNATNANLQTLTSKAVTTDNLSASIADVGLLTAEEVDANYAKIGKLEAAEARIGQIESDYIKTGGINAGTGVIDNVFSNYMLTDTFVADNATAATGQFTKYLTGVRVVGDLVEANTLKANTLLLKGNDGLYYAINKDASGLTTTQLANDKYKNKLDGSVIVAESVTANQIAGSAITANKIAANAITSAKIDAGAITSDKIAAHAITADKINVTDLSALGATIGGWEITDNEIKKIKTVEGVKGETPTVTTEIRLNDMGFLETSKYRVYEYTGAIGGSFETGFEFGDITEITNISSRHSEGTSLYENRLVINGESVATRRIDIEGSNIVCSKFNNGDLTDEARLQSDVISIHDTNKWTEIHGGSIKTDGYISQKGWVLQTYGNTAVTTYANTTGIRNINFATTFSTKQSYPLFEKVSNYQIRCNHDGTYLFNFRIGYQSAKANTRCSFTPYINGTRHAAQDFTLCNGHTGTEMKNITVVLQLNQNDTVDWRSTSTDGVSATVNIADCNVFSV